MYKIRLINMPFANLMSPSIALTQLKSITQERFPEAVSIEIVYLTHDFAQFIGVPLYHYISASMPALYAGFGDWFLRHLAFPDLPDNTDKYLRRYFFGKGPEVQQIKELVAKKRPQLHVFLDELIAKYELDQADLVGFTSMFMQNVASFALAKRLKQRNPRLITVMGGANCEFPMGKIIAEKVPDIDFVFSGPALRSFPDFVQHCLNGEIAKRQSIRGVLVGNTGLSKQGTDVFGEELSIDTPIRLDYDDFIYRLSASFSNNNFKPIVPLETSRGCWWGQRAHCTFCGLNGTSMTYRAMEPKLAIRQFESLFRYSGKVSLIEAVDNILPKSYLEHVLPFLNTPKDMSIFYEVKADLTEQELAILAQARVTRIQPGIESLATSTLKLMKKGTTSFQNVNFLKNCALYGVKPYWNILVGFPGEAVDVYRHYVSVIPQLTHLDPPSGVYPIRFDRFSPYHSDPKSYGLDLAPMDFYFMIYPFNESELNEFAYYFSDRNLLADYFKNMTEWIRELRILVGQWQARWGDSQGSLPPRLYFKDEPGMIYDSRSGSITEHSVGKDGQRILNYLSRPVRMEELIRVFTPDCELGVGETIGMLQKKGLIFQEGDRLLSLVMKGNHGTGIQARTQDMTAVPA